jgi:HTH-type transcriptional regulator/antitoxin HigA
MGAVAIDSRRYARVLTQTLPRIIDGEKEHERVLAGIDKLMDRGDRRTPEDDAALNLLVHLVQAYEERHYPLRKPAPQKMLKYLMRQRKLKQVDLVPIFKSRGYVSDVINGKRAISKGHARRLAEFFKVSPDLFI